MSGKMLDDGRPGKIRDVFAKLSTRSSEIAGSAWAFGLALILIFVWGLTGPIFGFSDTWQLIINTGTTIITFLMVFLLQHAQNRDIRALQLKLDELIAAMPGASNRLIDLEDLSEKEAEKLRIGFRKLSKDSRHLKPGSTTTIEELGVKVREGRKAGKNGTSSSNKHDARQAGTE